MEEPSLVQVGNCPGAYFALALFCAVFAFLAIGVWREIRRSFPRQSRMALTWDVRYREPDGAPRCLLTQRIDEAEVRDGRLVLHYLHPMGTEVELAHIAGVRAAPAFKEQWLLHVTGTRDVEYVSAISRRDACWQRKSGSDCCSNVRSDSSHTSVRVRGRPTAIAGVAAAARHAGSSRHSPAVAGRNSQTARDFRRRFRSTASEAVAAYCAANPPASAAPRECPARTRGRSIPPYDPSLPLAFKIARLFKRPIEEIFQDR